MQSQSSSLPFAPPHCHSIPAVITTVFTVGVCPR